MLGTAEHIGRAVMRRFDQLGFSTVLLVESFYWLICGRRERQRVRMSTIFEQMEHIGIEALPIVTLLSGTIGVMLAIQGTYSLGIFGAESFVYFGVALAVTREFAPLITGILIAGRSGSALAARLSTMAINQEIDALRAIGISPTRYLVVPSLIGMLVVLPALTIWSGILGIGAAGLFVSTTLDITMAAFISDGIEQATSGSIRLLGQDITKLKSRDLQALRRKIGVAFQGGALFSSMSVEDNVKLPLRELTSLDGNTMDIMARLKLELVNLAGFGGLMPSEFSGGMPKRAAVARAIVMDPALLFFDEPSAGLDPVVSSALDHLIRMLRDSMNMTIVVVTHELTSAFKIADRITVLDQGKVLAVDTVEGIRDSKIDRIQNLLNRRAELPSTGTEAYLRRLTGEA